MSEDEFSDPFEEPSMEIHVETLTGTSFDMKVFPQDTVLNIKNRIQRVEGIPVHHQNLLFRMAELEDHKRLSDVGIQNGSTLKLVLSMRGGPISTRRLTSFEHQLAWKDLKHLIEHTRDQLMEKGSKISLFVFKDGDIVNLLRIIENDDGTYSPYTEKDEGRRSFDKFVEDHDMLEKMAKLKEKMQNLNMRRHTRNKEKSEPDNVNFDDKSEKLVVKTCVSYKLLGELKETKEKGLEIHENDFEKFVVTQLEVGEIALKEKHRTKSTLKPVISDIDTSSKPKSVYSDTKGSSSAIRESYANNAISKLREQPKQKKHSKSLEISKKPSKTSLDTSTTDKNHNKLSKTPVKTCETVSKNVTEPLAAETCVKNCEKPQKTILEPLTTESCVKNCVKSRKTILEPLSTETCVKTCEKTPKTLLEPLITETCVKISEKPLIIEPLLTDTCIKTSENPLKTVLEPLIPEACVKSCDKPLKTVLDPVIAEVCVKNCEKSAKTVVDSVIEPIAIVAETIENGEVLANDAIPSPRSGLRFARLLLPDNGDRPKGSSDGLELEENAQDMWEIHDTTERLKNSSATCKIGVLKRRQSVDYAFGGVEQQENVQGEIGDFGCYKNGGDFEVFGRNFYQISSNSPTVTRRSPLYGRKSQSLDSGAQAPPAGFPGPASGIERLRNDRADPEADALGLRLYADRDLLKSAAALNPLRLKTVEESQELAREIKRIGIGCVGEDSNKVKFESVKLENLPAVKKKSLRCFQCNRRLNITNNYTCRCGRLFCAQHRYSEMHDCKFDYKSEGRVILERQNPLVVAEKLRKI